MAVMPPHLALHWQIREKLLTEKDPAVKKMLAIQDAGIFEEIVSESETMIQLEAEERMFTNHKYFGETYPLSYYRERAESLYSIRAYPAFKEFAIIYEKEGDLDSAIAICETAIKAGMTDDRTKGGMTGRLEKLKKKKAKEG